MKKSSMNLPNTLSLLRCALVPVFVVTLFLMREIPLWGRIVPAIVYLITGLTDMLDGKIARKYNLITDFGKFIDPLADKFMVFGALLALLVEYNYLANYLVWVAAAVMLRELAVTSIRLVVAGNEGIVVAASMFGKVKTVIQIVSTVAIIVEPIIIDFLFDGYLLDNGLYIISYIAMAAMCSVTVLSGIDYLKSYWKYIDVAK